MSPNFVHLHIHTEYSIVDGIVRIDDLMHACSVARMPAVAITDQNNFFGLVKFYKAAIASGIKPIFGINIYLHNEQNLQHPHKLVLLAQNAAGYKNLIDLVSKSYTNEQITDKPIIHREWLEAENDGIILLSGATEGDVGKLLLENNKNAAAQLIKRWQKFFPERFYLELQRTGKPGQEDYIHAALALAVEHNVPVVATNEVCFINPQDFEAHETRVCINSGYVLDDPKRPRNYTEQQYLRSIEEMLELFSDIPEALENTIEIAKRCNVELTLGKVFLPDFPVPTNTTPENVLKTDAENGLQKHLAKKFPAATTADKEKMDVYQQRLQYELDVINQMGFASYFLIVADFIAWSKNNDVPVGPGRGSGAGSLVAYSLGITDLDPIEQDLLFERFLNPERVSMPDFDIDFCMEGRDRVIEYVINHYGKDKVSQIITYGTMAARAAVRDVGRVLGYPYGFVDKIAKLIPFELGIDLEKALNDEELLHKRYEDEEDVKTLIDLAMKLEGITRNAGKHAGGVVIAPSKLTDFLPLYREAGDPNANLITQFDKNDVEEIGLVKFDFLGLRTLTIIKWALDSINIKKQKNNELDVDISIIPLDDAKTFKLLQDCATTAVFQLESRGMRDLTKRLKPDCFDDIVALVALFRPGPLQSGMVDDFIDRKHGRTQVIYFHPYLEPILRPTYGVIVYQEQVMQIAQALAGYSLGGADILRRAMGKKKPEEMTKQRAIFLEGAAQKNIDKHLANNIFDLMEKFAGYGFNKSHSAAYALIAYRTAWLKAHYPAEFMAAVLSSDMDNTDKVVQMLTECENMELTVIPPDINTCNYHFTVTDDGTITYGLGAIKGVGLAAIESILTERAQNGDFKDLFDLCKRVDVRKVNRKVLEALIRSGAMDKMGAHRAAIFASINKALQFAEQNTKSASSGQMDLFAMFADADEVEQIAYENAAPWKDEELLRGEKAVLGFYLSGHPIEAYRDELMQIVSVPIAELAQGTNKNIVIAGFVSSLKIIHTKTGNRMGIVNLDDGTANIDVTFFSELFNENRDYLNEGQLLIIEGETAIDNFSQQLRMRAQRLSTLEQARTKCAKGLLLKTEAQQFSTDFIDKLAAILKPFCGGSCPIYISYKNNEAKTKLSLGNQWKVKPEDLLLQKLKDVFGAANVGVCY
jgi:DNA polymerase III subunit alpha